LKSKNFSAAVLVAAVILVFAGNGFACGPFFPNNLLDGGDNALLQAPYGDFQHELELLTPVKTSARALPPGEGQTFRDQAVDAEMADLESALKHSGFSTARVTAILTEHLHQRAKLKAFQENYLVWRKNFNEWKSEYPWRSAQWITPPAPDPKEANELLYQIYVEALPAFIHLVGTEWQGMQHAGSDLTEPVPGIPDVDIGWNDWDNWNDYFITQEPLAPRLTNKGKLDGETIAAWLHTNPPPVLADVLVTPGLPVEFADYFRGVITQARSYQYPEGSQESFELTVWNSQTRDWYEAESWLEKLLELPEKERHYKSTWAEFMLGKMNEEEADAIAEKFSFSTETNDFLLGRATNSISDYYGQAAKHYQQVRELARKGFADSTGLAASSLGLEARVCLKQKKYERAIELYLEQNAAGDGSAVNSLRFTAAAAFGEQGASPAQLAVLAKNPRARRILTAYLISRNPFTKYDGMRIPATNPFFNCVAAWLEAVEASGVKEVESASQFALAAYQAGRMDLAQRWIRRAGNEPVAQWLQAKLFLHDGKIAAAAKLLAQLIHEFPQAQPDISKAKTFAASLSVDMGNEEQEQISAGQQALGELGVLQLARREYAEALDALLRSSYWMDAAYVAERVMTSDELKSYVDRSWPAISTSRKEPMYEDHFSYRDNRSTLRQKIRYLLARRLARDGRFAEARNYFDAAWQLQFDALVAALKTGRDVSVPPAKRAEALMNAAFITRTNGMELLGTELAPDWFIEGGNFQEGVTWEQRAMTSTNTVNAASADEIARGKAHHAEPEERWHYRDRAKQLKIEATGLFWDAAQLTPDNSDETARLLIRGGTILDRYDPKAADKFYKALVRRCGQTAFGQQADKLRWFPKLDENGNLQNVIPDLNQTVTSSDLEKMFVTNGAGEVFCYFPVPGKNYCVHYGDTLTRIARAASSFGERVTVQQLMDANPDVKPLKLRVGELILIPGMRKRPPAEMPATNTTGMISPVQASTNRIAEADNSQPTIAPPVQLSPDGQYVIRAGDTLLIICRRLNELGHPVTFNQLLVANPGLDSTNLKVGQVLTIPKPTKAANSPTAPRATHLRW
jgi:LysM repeat protein